MAPHPHADAIDQVRAFALSLPDAWEDHPWEHWVAKVAKRIFVFGPGPSEDGERTGLGVKLLETGPAVLELPNVEPSGYGLGKSGWVQATFAVDEPLPVDLLEDWIDESYRAIAGVRRIARLDAQIAAEGGDGAPVG
jgi:predicted DNA-binding protein (MmcQ/YjbR family)